MRLTSLRIVLFPAPLRPTSTITSAGSTDSVNSSTSGAAIRIAESDMVEFHDR